MNQMIYLDNAATTFPKPDTVYREVRRCIEEYCGNPGRSGHVLSSMAQRTVYECRSELSDMFGLAEPENVVFTLNTTYALNIAIKALLNKNDHVIISNIEHNSVYRPVVASGVEYDIFNTMQPPDKITMQIRALIRPNTRMIICAHASNICPLRNPINAIGNLAREKGLFFIVDAAQSAGVLPINMKESKIDALCIPSHKSLYGIQGTGAVLFSRRFQGKRCNTLATFAEGGNGVNSLEDKMPDFLPERLEVGTLPTPAIAGLLEGVRTVRHTGIMHIRDHEYQLYRRLNDNLNNIKGIKVYCADMPCSQTLLFNACGITSTHIAQELDKCGVCVRAGFHCTPLCHKLLKTGEDGAVRVSFGAFNTLAEVDAFTQKLTGCLKQL